MSIPRYRDARALVIFGAMIAISGCSNSEENRENDLEMAGSVSEIERAEVLVFEPTVFAETSDQSIIIGEGDPQWNDFNGGMLASAVFVCANGRPVWMRSMNDVPTVVVTPSEKNLESILPPDSVAESDQAVTDCVKLRYGGAFRAGKAHSGLHPWAMSRFDSDEFETEKKN